MRIEDPDAGHNAFRTVRSVGTEGIDVLTIDRVMKEFDTAVPFIVKIDIEGFESDLFSSNTEWIRRFPLILIELHDWLLPGQACSQNFLKAISAENRDFVHQGETIFSISNHLLPLRCPTAAAGSK